MLICAQWSKTGTYYSCGVLNTMGGDHGRAYLKRFKWKIILVCPYCVESNHNTTLGRDKIIINLTILKVLIAMLHF